MRNTDRSSGWLGQRVPAGTTTHTWICCSFNSTTWLKWKQLHQWWMLDVTPSSETARFTSGGGSKRDIFIRQQQLLSSCDNVQATNIWMKTGQLPDWSRARGRSLGDTPSPQCWKRPNVWQVPPSLLSLVLRQQRLRTKPQSITAHTKLKAQSKEL